MTGLLHLHDNTCITWITFITCMTWHDNQYELHDLHDHWAAWLEWILGQVWPLCPEKAKELTAKYYLFWMTLMTCITVRVTCIILYPELTNLFCITWKNFIILTFITKWHAWLVDLPNLLDLHSLDELHHLHDLHDLHELPNQLDLHGQPGQHNLT